MISALYYYDNNKVVLKYRGTGHWHYHYHNKVVILKYRGTGVGQEDLERVCKWWHKTLGFEPEWRNIWRDLYWDKLLTLAEVCGLFQNNWGFIYLFKTSSTIGITYHAMCSICNMQYTYAIYLCNIPMQYVVLALYKF